MDVFLNKFLSWYRIFFFFCFSSFVQNDSFNALQRHTYTQFIWIDTKKHTYAILSTFLLTLFDSFVVAQRGQKKSICLWENYALSTWSFPLMPNVIFIVWNVIQSNYSGVFVLANDVNERKRAYLSKWCEKDWELGVFI